MMSSQSQQWMMLAIEQAQLAAQQGEIPVGAVIVQDNKLIAVGYNTKEGNFDPTNHAEIMAIRQACQALQSWRLADCELYVTLEPCIMCAGAIHQARIKKVYFSTFDTKCGACGSLYTIHSDNRLNHRFPVEPGLMLDESRALLKDFFKAKRTKR